MEAEKTRSPFETIKSIVKISLQLLFLFVLVLALTNPDKDEIISEVSKRLIVTTPNEELVNQFIKRSVSVKSYVLFTVARARVKGYDYNIAHGFLGNAYTSNLLLDIFSTWSGDNTKPEEKMPVQGKELEEKEPTRIARLVKLNGDVRLKTKSESDYDISSKPGQYIYSGDAISVGEKPSFAVVLYENDKSLIKIRENSEMRFNESEISRDIFINKGVLLNDIKDQNRTQAFRIITESSIASIKGTEFAVLIIISTGEDKFVGKSGNFDVLNLPSGLIVPVGPGQKAISTPTGELVKSTADPGDYPLDPEIEYEQKIPESKPEEQDKFQKTPSAPSSANPALRSIRRYDFSAGIEIIDRKGLVIYLAKASFGQASIYEFPSKDSQIISTFPSGQEMYVFPIFREDFLLVGKNNIRPLGYVNVGDIQFSAADRLSKIKDVSKANFLDSSEFE